MEIHESAEDYLETILMLTERIGNVRSVLGKEVADMIYERHKFFSSWLMKLGVNKETALEDACRIEHVISKESFAAIKSFLNSYNN